MKASVLFKNHISIFRDYINQLTDVIKPTIELLIIFKHITVIETICTPIDEITTREFACYYPMLKIFNKHYEFIGSDREVNIKYTSEDTVLT